MALTVTYDEQNNPILQGGTPQEVSTWYQQNTGMPQWQADYSAGVPGAMNVSPADVQKFSQMYATNPNDSYFQMYGAFPSDPAGQAAWFQAAQTGGNKARLDQESASAGAAQTKMAMAAFGGLGALGAGAFAGAGGLGDLGAWEAGMSGGAPAGATGGAGALAGTSYADMGLGSIASGAAPFSQVAGYANEFGTGAVDPLTGQPYSYDAASPYTGTTSAATNSSGGIEDFFNQGTGTAPADYYTNPSSPGYIPNAPPSLLDALKSGASSVKDWAIANPLTALSLGITGAGLLGKSGLLGSSGAATSNSGSALPGKIRPSTFNQTAARAPAPIPYGSVYTGGTPFFNQSYTAGAPYLAAHGGSVPGSGIASLGSYSDGGRMLKGPGTGLSDSIPASINGQRKARLADGEFVVPADVVSALGGGSSDAGSRKLYALLDRVRQQAHGSKRQVKKVSDKVMPV